MGQDSDRPLFDDFDKALESFITGLSLDHTNIAEVLNTFYDSNGKFFPDDPFYESRMTFFWDHYIFNTSALVSGAKHSIFASQGSEAFGDTIDGATYSLYRVKKVKPQTLLVIDEITQAKVFICARKDQNLSGFSKGDYIQVWLYEKDGKLYMSRGLIMHPAAAKKSLNKVIKNTERQDSSMVEKFLSSIACKQIRHVRHQHVAPERIYRELVRELLEE